MVRKKKFLVINLIVILFLSGCVEEKPSELENITKREVRNKTFKVGETASDGKLAITLNDVKFVGVIKYNLTFKVGNRTLVSTYEYKPKAGYRFLILGLSVENLYNESIKIFSSFRFEVRDETGNVYQISMATPYLKNAWKDGELLPGKMRRGYVAYEVPLGVQRLEFNFLFEAGKKATFELQV